MNTQAGPRTTADLGAPRARTDFVGTLVGESTSREFRLAIAREAVREQDIIAVDVELQPLDQDGQEEQMRLWAKVQRIERINPLFPVESGHELAETRTNPFDTVLSLSREMVTAVCQVLGSEPFEGSGGRLDQVRYPPQPASQAYRPATEDLRRVVLGDLQANRALDLATLSNRPGVDVHVDGHAIVTRHLAILAMTGAGKSVTARRVVEELAGKQYPIVIFDPHGDYTGLADVPQLAGKVQRYYAQLPVFDEEPEKVVEIVESLAWRLADNQRLHFDAFFHGAAEFLNAEGDVMIQRRDWLASYLGNPNITQSGLRPNLYYLADFVQAVVRAGKDGDNAAFTQLTAWCGRDYSGTVTRQVAGWIEGLIGRLRIAAKAIRRMETISRRISGGAEPLPTDRTTLVRYDRISVISLAGYTSDFQAAIYNLVAGDIFDAKVRDDVQLPVLFVLEEAHNFAPGHANTEAERRAVATTKQIAQEGRKFGVGLVLISQRPSRLDETALAMCNSFVIMRMVNPADQRFVRTVVESLGEDNAKMLPDLDIGEAILSGQLINFPVLVRIKMPASTGEHEEEDAFVHLAAVQRKLEDEQQQQRRRG